MCALSLKIHWCVAFGMDVGNWIVNWRRSYSRLSLDNVLYNAPTFLLPTLHDMLSVMKKLSPAKAPVYATYRIPVQYQYHPTIQTSSRSTCL